MKSLTMIHYHIRWADSKLDWEAFQTEEVAKAAAEELKRPGEGYAIEKSDGDCRNCKQVEARYVPLGEKKTNPGGDLNTQ
jgi:hypothetical protein